MMQSISRRFLFACNSVDALSKVNSDGLAFAVVKHLKEPPAKNSWRPGPSPRVL
jgi:hypothetical protein